jgi:hypothetical protein
MHSGSLAMFRLLRKVIGALLAILIDDFYSRNCRDAGSDKHGHHLVDHSVVMSLVARYGVGCDLEFAEYSIIQFMQAIKAASDRR